MKIGIATTLSVAGVLAAGGAAFALNSAVLSESPRTAASIATLPSPVTTVPAAQGSVTDADDGPITPAPTKVNETVTTYRVASAGNVIIDTAGGGLKVTDIVPASGWTAEPARLGPDGTVKVHFVNGTSRVEFTARMGSGGVEVNAATEVRAVPPVAGMAPTGPAVVGSKPSVPKSLGGGDDDDNSHEEDHHSGSDHHEDEDDD